MFYWQQKSLRFLWISYSQLLLKHLIYGSGCLNLFWIVFGFISELYCVLLREKWRLKSTPMCLTALYPNFWRYIRSKLLNCVLLRRRQRFESYQFQCSVRKEARYLNFEVKSEVIDISGENKCKKPFRPIEVSFLFFFGSVKLFLCLKCSEKTKWSLFGFFASVCNFFPRCPLSVFNSTFKRFCENPETAYSFWHYTACRTHFFPKKLVLDKMFHNFYPISVFFEVLCRGKLFYMS